MYLAYPYFHEKGHWLQTPDFVKTLKNIKDIKIKKGPTIITLLRVLPQYPVAEVLTSLCEPNGFVGT